MIENACNFIGKGFVIWNDWKNAGINLINLKGMKYSYLKTNILEFSYIHNHVFQNSFVFNCKKGIKIWMLVNYEKNGKGTCRTQQTLKLSLKTIFLLFASDSLHPWNARQELGRMTSPAQWSDKVLQIGIIHIYTCYHCCIIIVDVV